VLTVKIMEGKHSVFVRVSRMEDMIKGAEKTVMVQCLRRLVWVKVGR